MPLITWSEKYSVENSLIDIQHKKLVEIINELHDALAQGKGGSVVKPSLESLYKYTVEHFLFEESVMKSNNYINLVQHQLEHNKFTSKVKKFIDEYNNGRSLMSIEILNFLKEWLVDHIMISDKQYISHIK